MSGEYQPYTNPVAFDALTFRFGDDAQANAFGSSAVVSGSDSVLATKASLTNAPATQPKSGYGLSDFVASVLNFTDAVSADKKLGTTTAKSAGQSELERLFGFSKPGSSTGSLVQTLVWSVVLVVLALFMFSRGLGLIGEEGASTLLEIEDPGKYPGIGHAIQRMKGPKK